MWKETMSSPRLEFEDLSSSLFDIGETEFREYGIWVNEDDGVYHLWMFLFHISPTYVFALRRLDKVDYFQGLFGQITQMLRKGGGFMSSSDIDYKFVGFTGRSKEVELLLNLVDIAVSLENFFFFGKQQNCISFSLEKLIIDVRLPFESWSWTEYLMSLPEIDYRKDPQLC
ncbi:hypothetical protein FNV43_RR23190 [Rhamnella rubrinervis]|uniref:Uncharacterized protein n=1 Tax=Rhamnella rubrinervis TaxID=2594499 RepID=A0A8K0DXI1_9ROSA|nr:hypothetical protein FNV43_RR23190 [Rhamnella rubrinervis]